MTLYKVRLVDSKLYYDTLIYDRRWTLPFTKNGNTYFHLNDAQKIKAKCAELGHKCEIVMLIQHTIEVGTISKNGKLNVSLNQVVS